MSYEFVLLLIAAGYLLGLPIAVFVLLSRTRLLRTEIDEIRAALQQGAKATVAPPAEAAGQTSSAQEAAPPAEVAERRDEAAAEDPVSDAPESEAAASRPPGRLARHAMEGADTGPSLVERLRDSILANWMVWVGGLALALGGLFLVRYAIDVGLLSPVVRILLGLLAGAAMVSAGEWLRQRHLKIAGSDPSTSVATSFANMQLVPAVLAGAGLITLYSAIFAADTFYDLIPPGLAFILLGLVAFGAVVLSLLHGPAIAILGLAGALVVPMLIDSDAPSAFSLFGYLALVIVVMVLAAHYRGWSWLGWAALGGGAFWVLFWLATIGADPQSAGVGAFIVFLAFVPLWQAPARAGGAMLLKPDIALRWPPFVWGAVSSMLAFLLVRGGSYDFAGLLTLFAVSALYLAGTWAAPARAALVVAAAVSVLAALGTWDVPAFIAVEYAPVLDVFGGPPIPPPEFRTFTAVALAFAALYFGVGFAAIGRVRFSDFWASVSAAMPVLILALAYWRWTDFDTDQSWAGAALALAALNVFAANRVARSRGPLGAYATACVAALSLALAMLLRDAWLTAALSLQLPAIAIIAERLNLRVLRHVALAIAGVALVRLLGNPYLIDYPIGATPVFNWILYGYGVPAAAFWIAARRFLRTRDDWTVEVLEGGAVAFVTVGISLQIRHLFTGALGAGDAELWETAVHSASWISISYALYSANIFQGRKVLGWASLALRAIGATTVVVGHLVALNPLWTPVDIGNVPVFNALGLAYLLPAIFAFLYLRRAQQRGDNVTMLAAAALAFLLMLAYLTLEVTRAFRGPIPFEWPQSEGESYGWSVIWLLYAIALLILGIWKSNRFIRLGGLTMLALTTLKVFVFDMAGLTGGLRALSFIGLGIVLVAIGYLYQRFAGTAAPPDPAADASGEPPPES